MVQDISPPETSLNFSENAIAAFPKMESSGSAYASIRLDFADAEPAVNKDAANNVQAKPFAKDFIKYLPYAEV
ncbi:hypothetical protein HMPREF9444_00895 [Succinatimonas hippei YIT 12066]|uniref:Uncharacterized protein n=1 Tax=Succinatimonas hippei (strain DSM 22608 / JCM 16073 / KCTC 15190 / YIT 12066) TaxID=762983 RepID=E8LJL5_SUCHY|nr:hypothetical protein HMPREF9444_00895 [Succinatimonas hippei YIT 12066]